MSWVHGVDVVTLFVEDVPRSKSFYLRVFGLPVIFEDEHSAVFDFANLKINLLTAPAARELVQPEGVGSSGDGSRFQFTIRVDDADAVSAELTTRGVTLLSGPVNRPWGVRTASFTDPDGHIWEIAQQLGRAASG
jgi:catechol 2,3-dioxygenase-like lactoylglutathione lyase family enzyme